MRYWVELSGRKHALVVAGAIETRNGRQFRTTLVAFRGVLCARYVKRYPEPEESLRFTGGRSHCIVHVPDFLGAVVSASELADMRCTAVFDYPGVAIGLVSGTLAKNSRAPHPTLVSQRYGIFLICSNLAGTLHPRRGTVTFSGYCGVYGPRGSDAGTPGSQLETHAAGILSRCWQVEGDAATISGIKRTTLPQRVPATDTISYAGYRFRAV
jgi:hypothetical protein